MEERVTGGWVLATIAREGHSEHMTPGAKPGGYEEGGFQQREQKMYHWHQ